MPVLSSDYRPKWLFRNGHINTLFPYLFRKSHRLHFTRERLETPDGDFFDVDWKKGHSDDYLVILLHGLEGSSASQYINGISRLLYSHQTNVAALHFRSCSGEMNRTQEMYHSGFTKDLYHFLQVHGNQYNKIFICGFSLGGNVAMKFIGDGNFQVHPNVKAIAGISVPCDLEGGSIKLKKWYNHMYEKQFLYTLLPKMHQKHQKMPDIIQIEHIKKVQTLWDFDEYFTSKMHGMVDARDYYQQCSSLQFLHKIKIPALMINAQDDSFLPKSAFPYAIAEANPNFYLMAPPHGGHVGFTSYKSDYYWNELQVLDFFLQHGLHA